MDGVAFYNKLKLAVNSTSERYVWIILHNGRHENDARNLHDYMCQDLPKHTSECSRCESLLLLALRVQQGGAFKTNNILRLLLEYGAYPSDDICAAGYPYNHTRSTPLKRAVQSGSVHDVKRLLTSQGAADDVNWHPRFCMKRPTLFHMVISRKRKF